MITLYLLTVLIAATVHVAMKIHKNYTYFKRNGVPYLKDPHWLFGSITSLITGKINWHEGYEKMCNAIEVKNEPFFGIFLMHKPTIVIQNPELAKRILVKDFNSFADRSLHSAKHDPIGHYNMFSSRGDLWKQIRQKFTPFFTSGRLKMMYYLIDRTGDEMIARIEREKQNATTTQVDLKNLFYLCTTDIIARCAFGVDAKSLENPNGEFARAARIGMRTSLKRKIDKIGFFFLPKIAKLFRFKLFSPHTSNFIMKTVPEVMDLRRQTGLKRHDLIDQLIELDDAKEFESIDILIAQAGVFFVAGHESSSTTLTMAMFEISNNIHVQSRLRNELKKKLNQYDGRITYDMLMMNSDFPYLHQVVLETLRKYPATVFLERMCVNPDGYSFAPFSDFRMPPGMSVQLPLYATLNNPKHFPEPEKFDPERFADWNNVSPYVFFPFGTGPRGCVAERFAMMAVKTLIAKILMNYRVEHLPSTPRKIELLENVHVTVSKVPLQLNFIEDSLME